MTLPNFLYIGPPKSASTWLFNVLKAHPQIYLAEGKDIYFFDRYFDRGLDWYESHFKLATKDSIAVGEISHDYIYSKEAADRIKSTIPDVKILSILRNPFERSRSDFRYINQWSQSSITFAEAINLNSSIISNSLYSKYIQYYIEKFDRDQIHIMLYDDLVSDPKKLTRNMLDFLGVPYVEDLPVESKINVSSTSRIPWLTSYARKVAQVARDAGLASVVGKLKYSPLRQMLFKPAAPTIDVVDPASQQVLEQAFVPDILELQHLIGRDLTGWLPTRSRVETQS